MSETGYSQFIGEVEETLIELPHSHQNISKLALELAMLSRRLAFGIIFTCTSCQEVRVVSKDERLVVGGLYRRDDQPLSGHTVP